MLTNQRIVIGGALLAAGAFMLALACDSTAPVAVLTPSATRAEAGTPMRFSAIDSTDNIGFLRYQWWTLPRSQAYAATGHYDQRIYVDPERDLLAVFTANIADEDPHPTEGWFQRYIVGACTG